MPIQLAVVLKSIYFATDQDSLGRFHIHMYNNAAKHNSFLNILEVSFEMRIFPHFPFCFNTSILRTQTNFKLA